MRKIGSGSLTWPFGQAGLAPKMALPLDRIFGDFISSTDPNTYIAQKLAPDRKISQIQRAHHYALMRRVQQNIPFQRFSSHALTTSLLYFHWLDTNGGTDWASATCVVQTRKVLSETIFHEEHCSSKAKDSTATFRWWSPDSSQHFKYS